MRGRGTGIAAHRGVTGLLAALAVVLAACMPSPPGGRSMPCAVFEDPARLAPLGRARVLFGHQSVGAGLLAAAAASWPADAPAGIHPWEPGAPCPGPGIWHFRVGRNEDPLSKIEAFAGALADGECPGAGAAGFKFCFVDFDRDTDVEGLFRRYRETMERLGEARPGLVLYHCTVPLTVDDSLPRRLVKSLLGRVTARRLNAVRERFNDRLRQAYGETGLLFDLAALEAGESLPPGRAGSPGRPGRALRREWTEDGAHPAGGGARFLGCALVEFFAGPVAGAVERKGK